MMGFMQKFAVGVLKGMHRNDLANLIEDFPGEVGERLGAVLRDHFDDDSDQIDSAGIEAIERIVTEDSSATSKILQASIAKELKISDDSIINAYRDVMNIILEVMKSKNTSIVLDGFIHDADCFSYWHYPETREEKIPTFEVERGKIRADILFGVEIYIIPKETDIDAIMNLNLAIRKNHKRQLDHNFYLNFPKVRGVEEFTVIIEQQYRDTSVGIPDGAPSLVNMFASLATALQFQEKPITDLRETLRQFTSLQT